MTQRGTPREVFLAGEGQSELGSYAGRRSYWSEADAGVLCALLAKVKPSGWKIGGACTWKSIRKYRIPPAQHQDTRNVQAVALDARDAGCDALVFSRDKDNDERRPAAVEAGIAAVVATGSLDVVAGIAAPALEGWLLALGGRRGTESLSRARAKAEVVALDASPVAIVDEADLGNVAPDAHSLGLWLARAHAGFPKSEG